MKITASRREDIERRRAEYDAETEKYNAIVEEGRDNYRKASKAQRSAIEKEVSELIGTTSLPLEIRADESFVKGGKGFQLGWKVTVRANEYKKSSDDTALAWSWEVELDADGNLLRDSNSWSGLKACTPAQIADLEESVRVIKLLNDLDWNTVLDKAMPNYEDFSDKEASAKLADRKAARPDFEKEILNEELEDMLGGNVAIKLRKNENWRGNVYILPEAVTDQFVKGVIFPEYYADRGAEALKSWDTSKTRKDNLVTDGDEFVTLNVLP